MASPRLKNCQPIIRLASLSRGSAVKPTIIIIVRWEARAVREESLTCNSVAALLWTPYSQWRKRVATYGFHIELIRPELVSNYVIPN
jgi:hypothetical protein